MSARSNDPRTRPPSFWPIGLVGAYDSVAFAVVAPVLPAMRARAGASSLAASLIFASLSIGMIAGFGIGGLVVRRWGPRLAGVSGVALHLAADVLFISGHTTAVYSAARLLQGIGSGSLWMAAIFSVLTLWPTRPERRLGWVLTSYSVGSIAGPLLASLGGTVRPFAADAVLGVGALVAATVLPLGGTRSFGWHAGTLKDRRLAFASLGVLTSALIFSALEGSYTLHFATVLSQTWLGVLFAAYTLAFGVGAMLPVAARGPREGITIAQIGLLVTGGVLLGVFVLDTRVWWFVSLVVLGLVMGATEAGVMSVVASIAEGGILTGMVVYSQAFAVGYLIGPPGTTWLTSTLGLVYSAAALAVVAVAASATGLLVPLGARAGRDP